MSKTLPPSLVQNGAPNVEHPTALSRARTHHLGKDHTTECGPNRQLRPVVGVTLVMSLVVGYAVVVGVMLVCSGLVAVFARDKVRRADAFRVFKIAGALATIVGGLIVVAAKIHGAVHVSKNDVVPPKRRSSTRTSRSGPRSSTGQRRPAAATQRKPAKRRNQGQAGTRS